MKTVGTRVRVLDNYAGGLDNVVGRTGKILLVDTDGNYLLDIKGERKASWGNYMYQYEAIVKGDEIEKVDFDLKDAQGRRIEIGDTVAYGPLGGGVTIGTVVDIDEREGRYGYKTTKFRLECDSKEFYSDGDGRKMNGGIVKFYRWYEHSGRCVIIKKNPINENVLEMRSLSF